MFEISAKTVVKITAVTYFTWTFIRGFDLMLGKRYNAPLQEFVNKHQTSNN